MLVHFLVSKLAIIGSDNGLSPGRRQAIVWTNNGISLIRTLGTNFSELFENVVWEMAVVCRGLTMLIIRVCNVGRLCGKYENKDMSQNN